MIIKLFVLGGVGILMVGLVQSRIIFTYGFGHFRDTDLDEVYWSELSWLERTLFWGGLVLVIGAFFGPVLVLAIAR